MLSKPGRVVGGPCPLKYSEVVSFDVLKQCNGQQKCKKAEGSDSVWRPPKLGSAWGVPDRNSSENNGCGIWGSLEEVEDEKEDRQVYCCVPTGCSRYLDDPISLEDPGESVKMICSNESCGGGEWMHGDCFQDWEEKILSYLKNSGRARSWSDKQRQQNLWNKKGYDLAFKMCDCKCGRGNLRVDNLYAASRADEEKRQKKNKKKPTTTTTTTTAAAAVCTTAQQLQQLQQIQKQLNGNGRDSRSPLRIHRSSCSSGGSWSGSSPSSSTGTTPVTPPGFFMPQSLTGAFSGPPLSGNNSNGIVTSSSLVGVNTGTNVWEVRKNSLGSSSSSYGGNHFELVQDERHAALGHMFQHRKDLSVFHSVPRRLMNTHHIRVEDEGPHGNDEIRCQVLTCLSQARATSVRCVICCGEMTVFDKYPIIDGTFFLSPTCYPPTLEELRVSEPAFSTPHHRGNGSRGNHVSSTNRRLYLNAVCMYCMEGGGIHVGGKSAKSLATTTTTPQFPYSSDGLRGLRLSCRACRRAWSGISLVIGTMYAYDIFASMPCCGARLRCSGCKQLLCEPTRPLKFFSDYSRLIRCSACGTEDHHFVKPLDDVYVKNMP